MQCRVFGHECPLVSGWWFDVVSGGAVCGNVLQIPKVAKGDLGGATNVSVTGYQLLGAESVLFSLNGSFMFS